MASMRSGTAFSFLMLLLLLNGCSETGSLLSSAEQKGSDDVYFVEKDGAAPASSKTAQEEHEQAVDYYDPEVASSIRWERLRQRKQGFFGPGRKGYTDSEGNNSYFFRFSGAFGTPIGPEHLNTGRYWYYTRHLRKKNQDGGSSDQKKGTNEDRRTYEYGSGEDAPGVDFGTDGDPSPTTDGNGSSSDESRRSSGSDSGSDSRRRR